MIQKLVNKLERMEKEACVASFQLLFWSLSDRARKAYHDS